MEFRNQQTDFDDLNPLKLIEVSCGQVAKAAKYVNISTTKCSEAASHLSQVENLAQTTVDWDSCGWHYTLDAKKDGKLTCQYIYVLDSLNFCFWPMENFEYDTLATSLTEVLNRDQSAFDANRLASLTDETLQSWFPFHPLSQLSERVLRIRELGQALISDFNGFSINMVIKANNSVSKLVQLILQYLPGFRDTAIYNGTLVHIYKRAQILCADLWAAFGKPCADSGSPFYFYDIADLTMFADYRVPQILRTMGILEYSEDLQRRIDSRQEISFSSDEEVEIRACTIVAVGRLQQELKDRGCELLVIELDWLLWQKGEQARTESEHHRTLTIYY